MRRVGPAAPSVNAPFTRALPNLGRRAGRCLAIGLRRAARRRPRSTTLAGLLLATAVSAPTASAVPSDVGQRGPQPAVATDLRSPDARDAARGVVPSDVRPATDLRSPDTRDAAHGVTPGDVVPATVDVASDGFDWGTAGITAALLAGLVLVGAAVQSVARRSRRRVIA